MFARRSASRTSSKAAPSRAADAALLRGVIVGASALIGLCAAAPEASAQYGYTVSRDLFDDGPLIPPRAVAYRLLSRGFTDLGRPRFDGTAYIIDATSPVGARVRLFIDAQDGAIIGRKPLDIPYYPSAREARSAPGYGWTEEDVSRRSTRAAEGPIPPADIPDAAPSRPSRQAALNAEVSPRAAAPDANPLGLNPDGKARPAPPPKKSARLNTPQKPGAASTSPAAPAPKVEAADKPKPEAEPKQGMATVEQSKADAANAEPRPSTPAVDQEASERAAAEAIKAEKVKQDQKQDTAWRDPTPDESKRKVRVIDGATVVPGSGENAPAAAN